MSDPRFEQAARLAREWANLGPLEFDIVEELTLIPAAAASLGENCKSINNHYIETPGDQRFFDKSLVGVSGKIIRHTTSYSDGVHFLNVEFQQLDPSIPSLISVGTSFDNEAGRGGSSRPIPLQQYYIDKTPLHEALPSSTYLGGDISFGKPSHIFLFKDVFWSQVRQDLVIHLAEDGILPHRMISYNGDEARLGDRPSWKWEAIDLKSVQGKSIPVKSRLVGYDRDHLKRESSSRVVSVRKVEFGKPFPSKTFVRSLDSRAVIIDSVKGKITPPSARPFTEKAVVNSPIRVLPDTDYSGYLGYGGLAIGISVLVVALVLRVRGT